MAASQPNQRTPASQPDMLAARFKELAAQWNRERNSYTSHMDVLCDTPAYKAVIALGPPVVPLILKELQETPDHWFSALRAITGASPVKPENRGRLPAMVADWITWGVAQGLIEAAAPEPPAFKCPKCGGEELFDDGDGHSRTEPLLCANKECLAESTWNDVEEAMDLRKSAADLEAAKSRQARAAERAKPGGVFDRAIEQVFGKSEAEAAKGEGEDCKPVENIKKKLGPETIAQLRSESDLEQAEFEAAAKVIEKYSYVVLSDSQHKLLTADLTATRAALTAAQTFIGEVRDAVRRGWLDGVNAAISRFDATQPQHPARDPLRATADDA